MTFKIDLEILSDEWLKRLWDVMPKNVYKHQYVAAYCLLNIECNRRVGAGTWKYTRKDFYFTR